MKEVEDLTLVDKIRTLAKERNMSLPDLEVKTGLGNGTISRWKNASPNTDKLSKVADELSVSIDYLLGKKDKVLCSDCGLLYDPISELDTLTHANEHKKWQDAVKKYGFCWDYNKSFTERLNAEFFLKNHISKDEVNYMHIITLLKADFSDYLRKNNYCIDIDFNTFCSKKLSAGEYSNLVSESTYKELLSIYNVEYTNQSDIKMDENDISLDLKNILTKLSSSEPITVSYDGERIDPEIAKLFYDELEIAIRRLKMIIKKQ